MNEEIQNRLAALRDEYEKGRERLRELQRQQSQVEEKSAWRDLTTPCT